MISMLRKNKIFEKFHSVVLMDLMIRNESPILITK